MKFRWASEKAVVVVAFAFALNGCDPGVHVAWEKDFREPVDVACIEKALHVVAPDVQRTTYQSDGNDTRGFTRGLVVTQFNYADPTLLGNYTLDVAVQPDGITHLWHGWGKLGTEIPVEEQRQVLPLLNRANKAIEQRCDLSFADVGPVVGDG